MGLHLHTHAVHSAGRAALLRCECDHEQQQLQEEEKITGCN